MVPHVVARQLFHLDRRRRLLDVGVEIGEMLADLFRVAGNALLAIVRKRPERQVEPEPRSLAGLALHVNLAAVQLHQPLDQRQTEPGSTELARRGAVDLHEPLEDAVALRGVDADARIGDRNPDAVVGHVRFDADTAPLGRELDGV